MTRQRRLEQLVEQCNFWGMQTPRDAQHSEQCRVMLAAREQQLAEYVRQNIHRITIASGK